MKCNPRLLEAYLNNELDPHNSGLFVEHMATCPSCVKDLQNLTSLNNSLSSYKKQKMSSALLYSLNQIPFQSKKKFSLFNLLPREFAFVAASIAVALYFGFVSGTQILSADVDTLAYDHDYLEQISLVALIDR